jgi:pyrimidine operon attenuation protein/uracil phosphoribosyltransferase
MSAHQIMSADEIRRALVRISHEIVERHGGAGGLALVGIEHRGPVLAERLAAAIEAREGVRVPVSALDVTTYRDDRDSAFGTDDAIVLPDPRLRPFDPAVTTIVLVDDVLFTGRTVKAALDAITDYGRPEAVQLAVLVDRGHRELPIRPDFVGKNLPTSTDEDVAATVDGVTIS